jgi:quinol---cytochrome c reductase cytochrome c subunit, bacillus type
MKETYEIIAGTDAKKTPVRLLLVEGDEHPAVDAMDEPVVMTFPHLLVRELLAFLALSIGLVAISLLFDAPLEEIANPEKTPNPAKAPWYFLGLQELLHYYPPIVSGVLLPGMLIVALAVIPYFRVNLERRPLLEKKALEKLLILWLTTVLATVVLTVTPSQPAWPLMGPLWLVAVVASAGHLAPSGRIGAWLHTRSAAFWVFTWFLLVAVVLTMIGVFFRGPGWSFTVPWRDGVY